MADSDWEVIGPAKPADDEWETIPQTVSERARKRLAQPEPLHPAELPLWKQRDVGAADRPLIDPNLVLGQREPRSGMIPELAGGAVRGLTNLGTSFFTPRNVGIAATVAAGTAAAPVIAPLAAAGFGGLMTYGAAEALPELTQMAEDPNVPRGDVLARAIEVGGQALLGGAGLGGALSAAKGIVRPAWEDYKAKAMERYNQAHPDEPPPEPIVNMEEPARPTTYSNPPGAGTFEEPDAALNRARYFGAQDMQKARETAGIMKALEDQKRQDKANVELTLAAQRDAQELGPIENADRISREFEGDEFSPLDFKRRRDNEANVDQWVKQKSEQYQGDLPDHPALEELRKQRMDEWSREIENMPIGPERDKRMLEMEEEFRREYERNAPTFPPDKPLPFSSEERFARQKADARQMQEVENFLKTDDVENRRKFLLEEWDRLFFEANRHRDPDVIARLEQIDEELNKLEPEPLPKPKDVVNEQSNVIIDPELFKRGEVEGFDKQDTIEIMAGSPEYRTKANTQLFADQDEAIRRENLANEPSPERAKILKRERGREKTTLSKRLEDERGFINPFTKPPKGTPSPAATRRSRYGDYGLARLEEQAPQVAEAFAQVPGAKAQGNVMVRRVTPKLAEVLGGADKVEPFFKTLAEGELVDAQGRYQEMRQALAQMPKEEVLKRFNKKVKGDAPFSKLLTDIARDMQEWAPDQASKYMWKKLPERANALYKNGMGDQLKALIDKTFDEAGKTVPVGSIDPNFAANIKTPEYAAAKDIYDELIQKPILAARQQAGAPVRISQPTGTHFPLMSKGNAPVEGRLPARTKYGHAFDPYSEFRTGLSKRGYETSVEAFSGATTSTLRASRLNHALEVLSGTDLWDTIPERATPPEGWKRVRVSNPTHIIDKESGRRVAFQKGRQAIVPDWVDEELSPILEKSESPFDPHAPQKLIHKITKLALYGPLDAIFHYSNVISGLTTNVPIIGKGPMGKALGMFPMTKVFVAMARAATQDITSAAAIKNIEFLAQHGMAHGRYGTVTYSPEMAKLTGAERVPLLKPYRNAKGELVGPSLGPLLYGPKGIDMRARLVMLDAIRTAKPNASIAEIRQFVNRMGNYQFQLESRLARRVKGSGLAPFYTAGSTMIRNGFMAWGMGKQMPTATRGMALRYAVAQQLSGGAAGLLATWALAYKAYHDKWPWQDKNARLFKMPLKPEDFPEAQKALFGKKTSKNSGPAYVDFLFFNPAVGRGVGALARGAFETKQAGGTAGQVQERMIKEGINVALHPLAGPAVNVGAAAVFGAKPYVTGLTEQGRLKPSFMPVESGKVKPGQAALARLRAAGIGAFQPAETIKETIEREDRTWERAIVDLVAPRILGGRYNYKKTQRRLKQEQRITRDSDWEPLEFNQP